MNLAERLIQCRKDKAAIEQQEKEILKQLENRKIHHIEHIRVGLRYDRSLKDACPIGIGITCGGYTEIGFKDCVAFEYISKPQARKLIEALKTILGDE